MILAIFRLLFGFAAVALMLVLVVPGFLVAAAFYILSAVFADSRSLSCYR